MKYYKITLGHKGSEIYPFQLNTEQYNTFQEKRVEFDEMEYEQICEVLGVEDKLGSIAIGKFADMIILDQNLFDVEVTEIYGTKVVSTIVDGIEVYSN